MNTYVQFKSKLNSYSIIGSIVYGLFCASFPTPEVVALIGRFAYFLSAALFYFTMYVLYSENRGLVLAWWNNKWKIIGKVLMWYIIALGVGIVVYMVSYRVSYFVAADAVAYSFSRVLYYIPFLP